MTPSRRAPRGAAAKRPAHGRAADPLVGARAPDFTLPSSGGGSVRLSSLRGKTVVLYFYPKDDTPGCTTEACDFRDRLATLGGLGATVLGVSPDAPASHDRFAAKFGLRFPLLADADHRVAEVYGAWGEKMNYGKKYFGMIRSTFLIGPDGVVARAWRKVKAAGHAEAVTSAVRVLGSSSPTAARHGAAT